MSTKVEEVIFDDDINVYSQLGLADWMMVRKKYVVKNDIKTTIAGIEFDTVGCNNPQDIIDKYQSTFESMGLPNYEIRKVKKKEKSFTTIIIDNLGPLSTEDSITLEEFKINNQTLLSKLSPEEQQKFIEIASNYLPNTNNLENEEEIKNDEQTQDETKDESINNNSQDIPTPIEVTEEKNNQGDVSNMGPGNFNMKAASDASIESILSKMMENKAKYNQEVLCEQDGQYFSTQGCESIEQLYEKYNLTYNKDENSITANENQTPTTQDIPTEQSELDNQLEQLLAQQEKIRKNLIALEKYKKGECDRQLKPTTSYADRKLELKKKIEELEQQHKKDNRHIDEELISQKEQLENILRRPGRVSTDEENRVLQQYYTIMSRPEANNALIPSLLETIQTLPQSNEIKPLITNILEKISIDTNSNTMSKEANNSTIIKEELDNQLENAKKNVERLNSFFVDDKNNNNSAMPAYNKAIETEDRLDVLKAIIEVNKLDDSHMYKKNLESVLDVLDKKYYYSINLNNSITNSNDKSIEDVKANIDRLNSFIVDESIKNNVAMPFYNTAMETREKSDIIKAMVEVTKLDDSHMYKKPLEEALKTLYNNSYPNEAINMASLVEAQSSIERYNMSLNDEKIKNNLAMPFYNKALETNDYNDILKALEMTEQLPDNHMYKKLLESALIAMIDTYHSKKIVINNEELKQQYAQIEQEEQETIKKVEPLVAQQTQELEKTNQEIERIKKEIEKAKNPKPLPPVPPQPPKPSDQKPADQLSDEDYYKRLKEIANDGPIFHDPDNNIDLTPRKDKPKVIKAIKKASSNLRNKIRNSAFGKKISEFLEYIKNHPKLAKLLATAGLTMGLVGLAALNNNANAENNTNNIVAEQTTEDTKTVETDSVAVAPQEEIDQDKIEEKAEEEFNQDLESTLNNILGGNTKVHISADRAADGIEAKTPLKSSWENATPGAFYNMEEGRANELTPEEAQNYWQDGGQVIVRMDNGDTPIGFVPIEQQQDNNTGKSM